LITRPVAILPMWMVVSGQDTAQFYSGLFADYQITTSVDGKSTTVQRNRYVVHLTNVEGLTFNQNGTQTVSYSTKDFIDLQLGGPTNLGGLRGACGKVQLTSRGHRLEL
jgi:hypothetical protein